VACSTAWVRLLACLLPLSVAHTGAPLLACRSVCRSPFALPALLVAAPALFYLVLFATGASLDDAREAGWVSKPQVRVCVHACMHMQPACVWVCGSLCAPS
jgi:hypothetical protein